MLFRSLPARIIAEAQLHSLGELWQAMGGKPKATLHYAVTISVSVVEPVDVGPAVTDRVITITQGADRTQPAVTSPVPRP